MGNWKNQSPASKDTKLLDGTGGPIHPPRKGKLRRQPNWTAGKEHPRQPGNKEETVGHKPDQKKKWVGGERKSFFVITKTAGVLENDRLLYHFGLLAPQSGGRDTQKLLPYRQSGESPPGLSVDQRRVT